MVNYIDMMRSLETGTSDHAIYGHEETTAAGAATWPGKRVRDVASEIALLDANNAPLISLLMRLRKEKTKDPKFEWMEDVFPAQSDTIQTAHDTTTGDTTLDVSNGALFRAGDVIWIPDVDEVCYVESISTNELTVIRGVGGTSEGGASVGSGDDVFIIGNAQPMGWGARAQLTTQVEMPYNYTQLFKEAFEVTGTANATSLYGGGELKYLRRKHGDLHKRDIERAFWWGARDLISASEASTLFLNKTATASYLTRGVWHWISSSYISTNSGELTEDEFNTYLETYFRYGNGVKFMFCSPTALTVISGWGRAALQVVPRDTTFGINITRYISPHGELNLINNKLFQDISDASATENPGTCSVILDLEQLRYRYLRDTRLEMGIQGTDEDSMEDQYMTECGLEFRLPEHHGLILGWSQS